MDQSVARRLFTWGAVAIILLSLVACGGGTPEPAVEGDAETHLALGREHMDAGRTTEAIAEFQTVVRLDPGSVAGHFRLGNADFDLYCLPASPVLSAACMCDTMPAPG